MQCDFKPGDEVVCVNAEGQHYIAPQLEHGAVYVVAGVHTSWSAPGTPSVTLVGMHWMALNGNVGGYRHTRFRKVQRRDLTAWLATKNTVEGPVRRKVSA